MNTENQQRYLNDKKLQKTKRLKNIFLVSTIVVFGIALLLGILLILSLTGLINIQSNQIGSKNPDSITSKSFDKPEEVIEQFVLAVKNNDFENAIQLFAINNLVEGYDFEAYLDRLQAFMPYQTMAPQKYTSYSTLNQAYQYNSAANRIKIFVFSLLIPEFDLHTTISLNEIEDQNIDLVDALDPSQLSSLELVRMDLSSPEFQRSDDYQENVDKAADIFGFIEREEFIVLYKFEGDYYISGLTLVEYEEGWQIDQLASPLAGIDPNVAKKITEDEYLDLIGQ